MRKLKYHQYIPPDQRGASGTGGNPRGLLVYIFLEQTEMCNQKINLFLVGGAKQQSPTTPTQSLDPAYSHLLTQQQVFLQLQILQSQQQQQQQLTVVPRYVNLID